MDQSLGSAHKVGPRPSWCEEKLGPREERWRAVAQARLRRHRGSILVIGDSLAGRWPAPLQLEMFGRVFINLGVGGDRIEHVRWRLDSYDLQAAQAPAVLMVLGTNNFSIPSTSASIFERLACVIETIQARVGNAEVIVSEILPRGPQLDFRVSDISVFNRLLDKAQSRLGFRVLKVYDVFRDACCGARPCPLFSDPVHLSVDGYRLLGRQLQLTLTRIASERAKASTEQGCIASTEKHDGT